MLKRLLIAALWFYAGWTFGGLLSYATGTPEVLGPLLGAAAALTISFGPRRLVRRAPTAPATLEAQL